MAFPTLIWLFAFILTGTHNHLFAAAAETCYYPNGNIATDDSPCSANGGICCPLNWQCMDNGLCYLENEGYYERHTCTDRDWQSELCPRICTHDMNAPGNEAILWCNHEDWCCDGNRSWNCCTRSDTEFFDLPDPHSTAFISVTPSVTTHAASTPHSVFPSTISESSFSVPSAPSSSRTSTSVTASSDEATASGTTTTTAGSVSSPTSDSEEVRHNDSSRIGLTIGLALGIPLFLGTCGAMIFFLFHRRRKSKSDPDLPRAESPPMEANYQNIAPGSHAPELQGFPVAAKRSKSGRYSELYGSDVNIHSPAPSSGSSATSPPQYSPGLQNANGGGMAQIPEEPQELWGGYVPYRPSRTDGATGNDGAEENDAAEQDERHHSAS